jgi:hypothetical protein
MRRLHSWQGVLACFVALMALLAIVTFLPRLAYPSLSAQDLRGRCGGRGWLIAGFLRVW